MGGEVGLVPEPGALPSYMCGAAGKAIATQHGGYNEA